MWRWLEAIALAGIAAVAYAAPAPEQFTQSPNTWVKRSPLPDTPPSPRMGYEGACAWDSKHRVLIRHAGHNQGGGGEQNAELWVFDPFTAKWTLQEPNISPPGTCCDQQNIFETVNNRYLRFPAFSGSHGWQWFREIYLNDSSIWSYDLDANLWRNLRPLPAPHLTGLRCASWDSDQQVVVIFGGESCQEGTVVYDPYLNEWRWPKPKVQPEFRSGGNMAYDAARKLHILFGAQFSNDRHTWAYDLAKNEWRDMQPTAMPPTDKNDAVLTYDSINKVVLAIVKITQGNDDSAKHRLETWTYDAGANQWTKMNPQPEPDPSGNRARNLTFAPELGLALLENRTHKPQGSGTDEQQIWTYRYKGGMEGWKSGRLSEHSSSLPSFQSSRPTPPIIEDILVSVIDRKRVELSWKPSAAKDVTGYHVERAGVEVFTEDQLRRLKSKTPPLAEPSVGAFKRIGAFSSITSAPVKTATFTDTTIDLSTPVTVEGEPVYQHHFHPEHLDEKGQPYRLAVYAYRIRAVNARGAESGPSPAMFTIPSAPQFPYSKEDGPTCHLKWSANPEKGIKGYRVYRLDGRWDKDPLSRLTADPVAALTYSDPTAGKNTRRYHIVAVDALGQEGFPSAPVWFDREWKQHYVPFVGEWHQ